MLQRSGLLRGVGFTPPRSIWCFVFCINPGNFQGQDNCKLFAVSRNLGAAVAKHTKSCFTLVFHRDANIQPGSVCLYLHRCLAPGRSFLTGKVTGRICPQPHCPGVCCLTWHRWSSSLGVALSMICLMYQHKCFPIDGEMMLTWPLVTNLVKDVAK